MKARLKWTSRRQLHAAKAIVCASRLFLSRKELERRKLNHCSPSSAAFDANLGNVKRLFEVKLDAVSSSKIKNEQHRSRLQQRKEIILQIVKTIDFQSKFLQKVEEQSKCLQGVKDETLCLLDLNVAKAKDCQEILGREIAVNPNEFFQSWAQRHMDDFEKLLSISEKFREGIKAKEKERLETDMFVLQSSQRLTFQKVETLWALEGYESEIYSFEHEKSKDISVTDSTIKYLDRTANCISSTEACLEKLYGESLLFYEKQEESMSNVVIFQKDPSIQCVAKESARDRLGKLSFDADAWTKRYESKPWLIQQERHYSLQRIRKTFDHIDIRREDLLAKGTQKRSTEDTPKLTAEGSKAYKGVRKALSLFHRVKASSKLGDAKVRMQNSVKSFSRAIQRKSQIDYSKDDEFQTILANVRRDLQQNDKGAIGVASLKFTVGEDESDLFSTQNESNIALGKSYYSIQLNLGNVILWLHLSKKKAGLITDLMIVSNKDQNISSNQEIVSHPLLQGGILITRDNRKPKVVSNLQIVYAHSNQGCSKGYDLVDGALDVLGEVSPGQMFAKKKNRLENSDNVSLSRMQKDLVELKKKQKHLSNDVLLKEMVDELEKRIAEMTPFREERGTSHLDYVVDYLALDSKTVLRLKQTFPTQHEVNVRDIILLYGGTEKLSAVFAKLFALLLDQEGEVLGTFDVGAYVRCVSSFCVLSNREIIKLLFKVLDEDDYGVVHMNDVVKTLNGTKNGVNVLRLRSSGSLSYEQFETFLQQRPKMTFEVFLLQDNMRKVLGKSFWLAKMKKFKKAREIAVKEYYN